jgi:hypothetical protein
MSISGQALGILIANKTIPLTADPESRRTATEAWIKVGDAICEFLSAQTVLTTTTTLAAPGPVVLANGGGPATGTIILPPLSGQMLLP